MVFTVRDYHDLIQLLSEHPEWREELRRTLLSDDFLALPQIVRELAEAQRRTDERLEALTARVAELAEAQRRTDERLESLAARVEELAEAQRRTDQRLEALAARVAELAEAQRRTELQVQRLTDRLARLDGRMLEIEYRDKAASYFGRLLRRARAVEFNELEALVEEHLTAEQISDLLLLDLVVRGQWRQAPKGEKRPEGWLAVEVSTVVDRGDVERAKRRAGWLRQAGLSALPVAAGEGVTAGGEEAAKAEGVILQTDGKMAFVAEALRQHS